MPQTLKTPAVISDTITEQKIETVGFDLVNRVMHIGYVEKNADGADVRRGSVTVEGLEFTQDIKSASEKAGGVDVFGIVRQVCYERVATETGADGDIS